MDKYVRLEINTTTARILERLNSLDELASSVQKSEYESADVFRAGFDTLQTDEKEELLTDLMKWAKSRRLNYEGYDQTMLKNIEDFQTFFVDSLTHDLCYLNRQMDRWDGNLKNILKSIDMFHRQFQEIWGKIPHGAIGENFSHLQLEQGMKSRDLQNMSMEDRLKYYEEQQKHLIDIVRSMHQFIDGAAAEINEARRLQQETSAKLAEVMKNLEQVKMSDAAKEELLNNFRKREKDREANWSKMLIHTTNIVSFAPSDSVSNGKSTTRDGTRGTRGASNKFDGGDDSNSKGSERSKWDDDDSTGERGGRRRGRDDERGSQGKRNDDDLELNSRKRQDEERERQRKQEERERKRRQQEQEERERERQRKQEEERERQRRLEEERERKRRQGEDTDEDGIDSKTRGRNGYNGQDETLDEESRRLRGRSGVDFDGSNGETDAEKMRRKQGNGYSEFDGSGNRRGNGDGFYNGKEGSGGARGGRGGTYNYAPENTAEEIEFSANQSRVVHEVFEVDTKEKETQTTMSLIGVDVNIEGNGLQPKEPESNQKESLTIPPNRFRHSLNPADAKALAQASEGLKNSELETPPRIREPGDDDPLRHTIGHTRERRSPRVVQSQRTLESQTKGVPYLTVPLGGKNTMPRSPRIGMWERRDSPKAKQYTPLMSVRSIQHRPPDHSPIVNELIHLNLPRPFSGKNLQNQDVQEYPDMAIRDD